MRSKHRADPLNSPSNAREYTPLYLLFPFNFRERGRSIACVVVVEQLPARPFRGRGGIGRNRYRLSTRDQATDIQRELLEIPPFIGQGRRPFAHRSVTWNNAPRRDGPEVANDREPAADAAVEHGNVAEEYKISRKEGSGLLVEYREIPIGMRARPGPNAQRSAAQIQFAGSVD